MQPEMLNTFQQEDHDLLVKGDSNQVARQEFVKSLKGAIQQRMLPVITTAYYQRAIPKFLSENGKAPEDYKEARRAFEDDHYLGLI